MFQTKRATLPASRAFEALDLYELYNVAQARDHFHAFRRYIHPDNHWGWWVQECALALQQFYEDLMAGKRPKLAIFAPPQHGKSTMVEDFIAWVAGRHPDYKSIFASYSDDLGVKSNGEIKRMLRSEQYQKVFPDTRIGGPGTDWQANSSVIEFVGKKGGFRNTTVQGQINGFGLHVGAVDDPHKNRAEASSAVTREKVWKWFTDDFFGRFDDKGALLVVMTRWHVDDMMGRMLVRFPDFRVVSYPAIAVHDEKYRKKGEALFPEWKSLDFLLERKQTLSSGSWESLYQQSPIIIGGGIFPIEKLRVINVFDKSKIVASVRYMDKACLVAGTLITTTRGQVPIEQVLVGDRVLTRQGFKRVRRAWLSKWTSELVSVKFANGSVLEGTPDHRVWTTNRGWVGLYNLGEGVYTGCLTTRGQRSWKTDVGVNGYSTRVGGSFGLKAFRITGSLASDTMSTAARPFTEKFGSRFMETSPVDVTSITMTGTGITTIRKIWSASPRQNTTGCTGPSLGSRRLWPSGTKKITPDFKSLGLWSRIGSNLTSAIIAISRSSQKVIMQSIADAFRAVGNGLRVVRDLALSAVANFLVDPTAKFASSVGTRTIYDLASGVEKNSLHTSQRQKQYFAAKVVPDNGTGKISAVPVYDLEVEDAHEFFANGILVHNSTAGGDGAYTSMVLMHKLDDKTFLISDITRGHWSALERETRFSQLLAIDGKMLAGHGSYAAWTEQEPGSGGKESAEATIRNNAGVAVYADKVTGSKEVRADPFAAQVQGGNVFMVAGHWCDEFLDQCENFPNGKHKDDVDACSGAFAALTREPGYDTSYGWA